MVCQILETTLEGEKDSTGSTPLRIINKRALVIERLPWVIEILMAELLIKGRT